jgi:hypothetical protein
MIKLTTFKIRLENNRKGVEHGVKIRTVFFVRPADRLVIGRIVPSPP